MKVRADTPLASDLDERDDTVPRFRDVPEEPFPRISFEEARTILATKYGHEIDKDDLDNVKEDICFPRDPE